MKRYCKKIEVLIVDYCDNVMNDTEKSKFEEHIRNCDVCRGKYEEFRIGSGYLVDPDAEGIPNNNGSIIYNRLKEEKIKKYAFRIRYALAVIVLIVIIFVGALFNSHYNRQRLVAAQNTVLNIEFVFDTDDLILEADDDTYEEVVSYLLGDDYKDFEEIIEETSIFKL